MIVSEMILCGWRDYNRFNALTWYLGQKCTNVSWTTLSVVHAKIHPH